MTIIIFLVCLVLFIFFNFFIKNTLKKIILNSYILIWTIVLLTSSFNPYKLYNVSDETYFIVFLSLFMFLIGTFTISGNYIKTKSNENQNKELIYKTLQDIGKNKYVFIIMIINVILIARYYLLYQAAVTLVGASEARMLRFFAGALFKSTAEIYFYNYYFETISIISVLYFSLSFVLNKINKLSILCIVFSYFFSSIGSGRFFLVELGYYILILYIIKKVYFKLKTPRILKATILFTFGILYLMSIYFVNFRRGIKLINSDTFLDGNDLLLEQAVVYNIGALRALDYGLNNLTDKINYQYFRLYLGGLDELFAVFLNLIGAKVSYANAEMGNILFNEVNIGDKTTFNALYTNIIHMYLDFNLLGVILCSFLNGYFFSYLFKRFSLAPSIFNIFVLVFFTVQLYLSTMNWGFSSPSSWLFCGLCIFLDKRWKIKIK